MDEVKDAIVIPVPDEEAGEVRVSQHFVPLDSLFKLAIIKVPRAYVVRQANCPAGFCEQDVIDFVSAHVAHYKRLKGGVRFCDEIPKSATGKLLRRVQIERDRALQ